jgi:hypothetical protein
MTRDARVAWLKGHNVRKNQTTNNVARSLETPTYRRRRHPKPESKSGIRNRGQHTGHEARGNFTLGKNTAHFRQTEYSLLLNTTFADGSSIDLAQSSSYIGNLFIFKVLIGLASLHR